MRAVVVLLALLAAVFMALGIVIRQRATMEVPPEHGVSPTMFAALARNPLWWAGTAVAVAGYGFQALALAHGSLLLVQPLLVSSLLFALPISAHLAHRRVSGSEWAWAILLTTALAVFVPLARPRTADQPDQLLAWTLVTVVLAPVMVVCVIVGARSAGRLRAVLLAAVVGSLFGVIAVLTKMTMHRLTEDGVWAMLTAPALYLVLALGVGATLLQQSALHAGALQVSVPTMLVLEPVVAVMLGVIVLGEDLAVTRIEMAAILVSLVAMTAATIALGRDEGALEEQLAAETAKRTESPSAQA